MANETLAAWRQHRFGVAGKPCFSAPGGVQRQGPHQEPGRVRRSIKEAGQIPKASGPASRRTALVQALEQGAGVGRAVGQVVRRRQDQSLLQLPGPPHRRRRAATRPPSSGKASRATPARLTYSNCWPRSNVRQRAEGARHQARATASRSTCPWCPELAIAMLACARIGAVHSVIFGGFSRQRRRRPHQRPAGRSSSSPPTAAGGAARRAAEGHGRRGAGQVVRRSKHVHRLQAHRRRGQHEGRAATTGGTS